MTVPLGPVPTTVAFGEANTTVGRLLMMRVSTPLGDQSYFFSPDIATQLHDNLTAALARLRGGLIVAAANDLPGSHT